MIVVPFWGYDVMSKGNAALTNVRIENLLEKHGVVYKIQQRELTVMWHLSSVVK